ncbi:hypothetical protein SEPCBS57363_004320, partial [Sporothrix epigloea]
KDDERSSHDLGATGLRLVVRITSPNRQLAAADVQKVILGVIRDTSLYGGKLDADSAALEDISSHFTYVF